VTDSVAVVMATYNGAPYIEEQLRSILDQTYPPSKILIRDDGSTDGTDEIARAILNDAAIEYSVVVNARRLGVTKNFEALLQDADSDYVALCDQDDVWASEKLDLSLAALRQHPQAKLCFTDAGLISSAGESLPGRLWDTVGLDANLVRGWLGRDNGPMLLRDNVVTGATMVVRRDGFLRHALPFPDGALHDYWLALVGTYVGGTVPISLPLLNYRQHENNAIGADMGRLDTVKRRINRASKQQHRLVFHEALLDRVAPQCQDDAALQFLRDEVAFIRRRCELPERAIPRLSKVLSYGRRGLYGRYASGLPSALVDIKQRPQ
jgi:glycosyltransferase involved in cell wall biosynthesis